ncbi:hypothetical protein M514_01319, partial [Trichuris suis]
MLSVSDFPFLRGRNEREGASENLRQSKCLDNNPTWRLDWLKLSLHAFTSLTVSTEGRQVAALRDADTTNVGTLSWKNVLRAICKPQFCPEAKSSNRRVPGTANSWSEAVALLGHGYTRWPFGID